MKKNSGVSWRLIEIAFMAHMSIIMGRTINYSNMISEQKLSKNYAEMVDSRYSFYVKNCID